ncbi:MAG: hypothetical protein ACOC5E_01000 [Acidobacteriota bacterium]
MPLSELLAAPLWAGLLLAAFAARFVWLAGRRDLYRRMMRGRLWQYWAIGATVLLVHVVATFCRTIELPVVAEPRAWSVAVGTAAVPLIPTATLAAWLSLRHSAEGRHRAVAQVFFHGAYAYPLLILLMESLGAQG